jgi:hypothetical protein
MDFSVNSFLLGKGLPYGNNGTHILCKLGNMLDTDLTEMFATG